MSLAVLNINDTGIQLALEGELVRTSPGYAVLDNGHLMTGEKASQNARLLPRWTNNRFWSQLTTTPLPNKTDQIRHHADLAFAHLEDLWLPVKKDVSSIIFVVPGYYTNENLGLLLGMAKECGLPVAGVVDQSVVAATNLPLQRTVLHLDIHLHAITLTRITNTGALLRRDVRTVMETGLFTMWDRWANIIANQFIQTTRFDPMHDASSEQLMFNQLPWWIKNRNENAMNAFVLDLGTTEHTVAVSNESLLKACTPLYPQIVQMVRQEIPAGESASLLLSHQFKGFPGLKDSLALINNVEIIDLAELKSVLSAAEHSNEIVSDTGSISHIVQLSAGELSQLSQAPGLGRATHLLWGSKAYAVGNSLKLDADLTNGPKPSQNPVCTIYPRGDGMFMDCHDTATVKVNGRPAEPSMPVSAGDTLAIGESELTFITVTGNN